MLTSYVSEPPVQITERPANFLITCSHRHEPVPSKTPREVLGPLWESVIRAISGPHLTLKGPPTTQ